MRIVVAKVGGSLFDLPDLRHRLEGFAASLVGTHVLFVPGGGAGADVIRQFDRVHHLGEEASHWLALRILTVNAHFLSQLLAIPVVSSVVSPLPPLSVLDAHAFCVTDDGQSGSLPHRWDVTSDSVAARVAFVCSAALVLLKSTDLEMGMSWMKATEHNLVDRSFATQVASVRVSWVNLRKPMFDWQGSMSSVVQHEPR